MSRYLIRRIEESPNIELRANTDVVGLSGSDHLEAMEWRNNKTGKVERYEIGALFSMTGAVPNSAWLEGCLTLDGAGFIKTGFDLSKKDLEHAGWPLSRPPYLLETSLPGVFAWATFAVATLSACVSGGRRVDCRVVRASSARRVIATLKKTSIVG
jgi:thioredoxin reductase (NADPH)